MSETSGINRYIKSNNQSLTGENYNEVDALVFSQLSYYRFEDVYPDYADKHISVQQFVDEILKSKKVSLSDDNREFLEALRTSERYADCAIHSMAAENQDSQWAALTVDINDDSGSSVIAMRGTDSSTLGWQEDFELAYSVEGTNAQKLSKQYIENSKAESIYLTGHSKGGNDVISAYVMSEEETRKKVLHIDNFDGPGVNVDFKNRYAEGYEELDYKLSNYYPENSVVGLLLNDNPGEVNYISANVRDRYKDMGILGEHDGHAFEIDEDDHLKITEQSELSDYLNQVLDETLEGLSQEERYRLIVLLEQAGIPAIIAGNDSPFTNNDEHAKEILKILYENGYISENNRTKYQGILEKILAVKKVVIFFRNMSEKEQKVLLKTIALVVLYGAKEAIELGIEKLGEKLQEKLERLKKYYNEIINVIKDTAEDITEGIRQFIDGIIKEVNSYFQDAKEWIEDKISRVKQRIMGYSGSADFSVNLKALELQGGSMEYYASELKTFYYQVSEIQRKLSLSNTLISSYRFRQVKNELLSESNNCKKMYKGLEKVVSQYRETEKKVINSGVI